MKCKEIRVAPVVKCLKRELAGVKQCKEKGVANTVK